jgi:hypothetical protein
MQTAADAASPLPGIDDIVSGDGAAVPLACSIDEPDCEACQ